MSETREVVLDCVCPHCGQRGLRFRCDVRRGLATLIGVTCAHLARLEWRSRARGQRPNSGTWLHTAARDAPFSWEIRGVTSAEADVAELRHFTVGHDERDETTERLCFYLRAWGCFLADVPAFVQVRRRHERIDELSATVVKVERQLRHRQRRGNLTPEDELRLLTGLLADWEELAALTGTFGDKVETLRARCAELDA